MLKGILTQLGMSDKEAKVYLASLELGPSPVQKISQEAKVNRATTYVVIDSLMEMGLMSTYEEGKKTYFTAEQPERLLEFLKQQQLVVQKKVQLLLERLPEFNSLKNGFPDKPRVKYYEGSEGIKTVQAQFLASLEEGDVVYAFLPYDDFYKSELQARLKETSDKRRERKIQMRIIYTSREGRQIEYERREERNNKKLLYVDYTRYPFSGGVNIYNNKIFMVDYLGKPGGVVIENQVMANMLVVLFSIIWESLKK